MHANMPSKMQSAKRWLIHRRKQPFYIDGTPRRGPLDAPNDLERLATMQAALGGLQEGAYDGVGFALGPDGTGNCWQGIDLDDLDHHYGLPDLAKALPG